MLIDRHGQAKILTNREIEQLLLKGFSCSRDKALFGITLYMACRISEGRQVHFVDAFSEKGVRDNILIRKVNTKGKQNTRTIPTHPQLAEILEEYRLDSLKLIELRESVGVWSHLNMDGNGKLSWNNSFKCPHCGSTRITKQGWYRAKGEQWYLCKSCKRYARQSKILNTYAALQNPSLTVHDSLGVTCSSNYGFLFANPNNPFLFTGSQGKGCISLRRALDVFDEAFARVGIVGASTHSCRRTALTIMHSQGTPLRVLQEISGHKDLGSLQRYLEVSEEQTIAAVNVLS